MKENKTISNAGKLHQNREVCWWPGCAESRPATNHFQGGPTSPSIPVQTSRGHVAPLPSDFVMSDGRANVTNRWSKEVFGTSFFVKVVNSMGCHVIGGSYADGRHLGNLVR